MRAQIHDLLPRSKGQLGLVATCLQNGITDSKEIVDSGAAANTGAVGNIVMFIRAIEDGYIPESAPSRARAAAGAARSFLKQHRELLSPQAHDHLNRVIEQLTEVAENPAAQEREQEELQERGDSLEQILASEGGVYAYTYPHYFRHPTAEGTSRTFIKVGMTTKDAQERVRQQARNTAIPEDPLLLRVYRDKNRSPRDLEKDFHDLLDAADHGRPNTTAGGKEWFETSLDFLDTIARKLGLTISAVDDES